MTQPSLPGMAEPRHRAQIRAAVPRWAALAGALALGASLAVAWLEHGRRIESDANHQACEARVQVLGDHAARAEGELVWYRRWSDAALESKFGPVGGPKR